MTFQRKEIIGDCTLYLGNCFEVLEQLGRFDAVITDPPYGIGFAAQPTKWQRRAGKEAKDWDDATIERLPELLSKGDIQAVWGGNYYPLPPSRGWLSWYKPDAPPSMASIELCWTNQNRNSRQISQSISATNAERVGHPTQKPLAVMSWNIAQFPQVKTIFDPFMGSGTTGVAAAMRRLSFVGVEIDESYFEIACGRIRDAYLQEDMFTVKPSQSPAWEQASMFGEGKA